MIGHNEYMIHENKYQYKTEYGRVTGFFNIYQGRDGKIYIQMGNNVTQLSLNQIDDLKIDYHCLEDFIYEDFKSVYKDDKKEN